ncbi:hypothetical protein VitviT2T_027248, partial [Vitis vinifera]
INVEKGKKKKEKKKRGFVLGFQFSLGLSRGNRERRGTQTTGMALGLILGIGRAFRRKRTSSLDILSSKRAPRDYYKGKNCKPTGFHTRKGGYVLMQEKLPNYVVPDLTDFKLKPYVSQCPREVKTNEATEAAQSDTAK